jgi:hypothetical protein
MGVAKPWYVNVVDFDTDKKTLTIIIDFVVWTRFAERRYRGDAAPS